MPYVATSVVDFWRRWHMTFSQWLAIISIFPSEATATAD